MHKSRVATNLLNLLLNMPYDLNAPKTPATATKDSARNEIEPFCH